MAKSSRIKRKSAVKGKEVKSYRHGETSRKNNPPVGLVKSSQKEDSKRKTYKHDPHLDPSLQWAGKRERPKFTLDTRNIHVHERIDPLSIINKLKKESPQGDLDLANPFEKLKLPFNKALEFYSHSESWSNRFIMGDSALIMNSLLEKEGMAGDVQCIYMDPPYGIKYSSNFQPFSDERSTDTTLSTEPEMVKAFRDTWELGIHSYLSHLYDRLLLCHKLLNTTGSCFMQIGDQNVHLVRMLMDEIFGSENYISLIAYKTTSGASQRSGPVRLHNYLLWYAKDKSQLKSNRLFKRVKPEDIDTGLFSRKENSKGERSKLTKEERKDPKALIESGWKLFRTSSLHSPGAGKSLEREFEGKIYYPPASRHWSNTLESFEELKRQNRIIKTGDRTIESIYYYDDFPYNEYTTNWDDTGPELNKFYVVQTSPKVIRNCILMASDPGDLVFDPTCGSGTTAYVAEETGRRWITSDTSRIAITLAKQRLLTSTFSYYKLKDANEGISGGIINNTYNRIKRGDIGKAKDKEKIELYNEPEKDSSKHRVTGPFTVEGLPPLDAPRVLSIPPPPPPPPRKTHRNTTIARTPLSLNG